MAGDRTSGANKARSRACDQPVAEDQPVAADQPAHPPGRPGHPADGGGPVGRTAPDRPRRRSRWPVVAAIPAVLALLVLGLVLLPNRPDGPSGPDALGTTAAAATGSRTTPPTATAPATTAPATTAPATTGAAAPGRFLTELTPDAGGGNVQRTGAHSLRMPCGSGESDDRFREVAYVAPAGYRSFSATVAVAGPRETEVQVLVLVDGQVVDDPVLTTGATAPLRWTGERLGRLALRTICGSPASRVTFTDPGLGR